jgi:virulence-associated protein VagC
MRDLQLPPRESLRWTLIESTKHFTEDFMVERNQPSVQQRDGFDQ